MAWYTKKSEAKVSPDEAAKKSRMTGLWVKCDGCDETLYRQELEKNLNVCPNCDHHLRWNARARLASVLDGGFFEEHDRGLLSDNPLSFSDLKKYTDKLKHDRRKTGEHDAFLSGMGRIDGHQVSVGIFNFSFMGGSMGSVVGEKVTRVLERAHEHRCAAIIWSSSGGARMHEGIFSLMQMAKSCAALSRFREVRKPFISVMLDPTTGGVAASFSWLGDVIMAEPKALIGFAGPRVIEEAIKKKLPEGFQRSEFLLDHGMIDMIVHRKDHRERLGTLLGLLS